MLILVHSIKLGDAIIVVKAGNGKKQKSFTLDKGLRAAHFGYFESTIKDTFVEGKTGIIDLKTEDPIVFGKFVGWLYLQRVEYTAPINSTARYREIIDLWVFADRFHVPLLMNAMIDALRDQLVEVWLVPNKDDLCYLYAHTAPGS